ncbi:hypothetical protein NON08_09445 [Cetobacterium somerae]|uniref:hypothetical protein n=1 Tax=Cetobacterium sp. NK01 TaxID=2993530 RepID=UPI0021161F97|nr:hypothetical protein [Cetobacterium sp. NK01]MCQ8212741.1 hypothetical protein [Cetobacterium sp. NK01]
MINRVLINLVLFICIFFTSFSKNEVTTLEALPKREKANLDIEVLKIKTEKITGVIYEGEKKIIFDFKDLKKAAEKMKLIIDSTSYDIFILENLDNTATYMKKNIEKTKLKNISYNLVEKDREKILEVSYDLKPETLYLGIFNNKTRAVEKIYKAEFKKPQVHSIGSLKDFSYDLINYKDIIIDPNHLGDYISEPITIKFKQIANKESELFPVITLGEDDIWEKEKHPGNQPVQNSQKVIAISFNSSSIQGKMIPQLRYKSSSPSTNMGVSKKIYYHNIEENLLDKIAIGAYETHENEFIEVELNFKIDASTIEQMKSYASQIPAGENELIKIPYKPLDTDEQITLAVGSSKGDGYYDIPTENIDDETINLTYPKVYIGKIKDKYEDYFSYNVNALKDHIIDEKEIENFSKNFYIASLGRVSVNRLFGNHGIDLTPTIGLGNEEHWRYEGFINKDKNTTINANFNEIQNIFINIGTNKSIYPYLTEINKKGFLFRKSLGNENQIDNDKRSVTLATYEKKSAEASITAEIKIAIPSNFLKSIRDYAYTKNEDIVEIPYGDSYKISLIPSSANNGNTHIYIPNRNLGKIREILYPKIKFKKKTGNSNTTGNFTSDHKLNNLEIGEKDLIETSDLDREAGFVHFQQVKMSPNDIQIPMIALGEKDYAPKGYLFAGNSTLINRDTYVANYNDTLKTYPYFKNSTGGLLEGTSSIQGGIQKSNDNSNLGIWVYSNSGREEVSGNLSIKIKNEDKKDFLTYIRGINSERVQLNTNEKIAFVQGEWSDNNYKFLKDSPIVKVSYPTLTVVKDIVKNNNIVIDFKNSYNKGEKVDFDFAGNTTNTSVEVNLNSGQFINGLELNDGKLEIFYESSKLISMDMNPLGDTTGSIQNSKLDIDFIYKNNGLVSLSLIKWVGSSHILKIIHTEKSGLTRREYTVNLKTPGSNFELISAEDLDFGTVLKGDNSKTATSKITIKNLSGNTLKLELAKPQVDLKNGNSIIKAGNFSISDEIIENSGENSYFILEGQLIETQNSILEGEHKEQIHLNVYLNSY